MTTNNTYFALTSSYALYDQHGSYLVCVFRDKPTISDITKLKLFNNNGIMKTFDDDAIQKLIDGDYVSGDNGYITYSLTEESYGELF